MTWPMTWLGVHTLSWSHNHGPRKNFTEDFFLLLLPNLMTLCVFSLCIFFYLPISYLSPVYATSGPTQHISLLLDQWEERPWNVKRENIWCDQQARQWHKCTGLYRVSYRIWHKDNVILKYLLILHKDTILTYFSSSLICLRQQFLR